MSSKRRKINGFLPIDKLAGELGHTTNSVDGGTHKTHHDQQVRRDPGESKRYKEYRRDPKVIEHLNHISTKDFLPIVDRYENQTIAQQTTDLDGNNVQNGYNSEIEGEQMSIREEIDDEGFEALEGTPPMKRPMKNSNGLLSSSPFDIWNIHSNLIVTKFNLSGELNTIDVRKKMDEMSQCLLKFTNDAGGPRIAFTHKNFDIKNAQVDFRKDCEFTIFDKDYSCMGMVLREPRFIDMDNKSKIGRVQTRLITWVNHNNSRSNKIHKIKDILLNIKQFRIRITENKKSLIKILNDIAIQDYKNKALVSNNSANETIEKLQSKRRFWEKAEFQSLGVQNRLSNYKSSSTSSSSSGHKIRIPTISDSPEHSSPRKVQNKTIPNINPLSFYSRHPADEAENDIGQTPVYSTFRKSPRTRSETPKLVQSTLWDLDDEQKLEIPQKLEPSLSYKFLDGTSYTITNQDFKCLYNHDWINDSILDFFTKFYAEKSIQNSVISREDMHLMSSFFYTKLVSDPNDYYGNVKKWVTNSDLFRKKYVVVPINMNFHWFGCIITNLNLVLEFFHNSDENTNKMACKKAENLDEEHITEECNGSEALPSCRSKEGGKASIMEDEEVTLSTPIITILTFDSLRQTHTREIDPIKEFLIAYAKDKYDIDLDKALIKMKTCAVPQQPNMSDCGVHVILNNMKFFDNPTKTIEVWRSTKTRSKSSGKVVNEYFEKNKRDTARKFLRQVIWDLHSEQVKDMEANDKLPRAVVASNNPIEGCDDEEEGDIEIIENIDEYKKALLKAENSKIDPTETNCSIRLPSEPPKTPRKHKTSATLSDNDLSKYPLERSKSIRNPSSAQSVEAMAGDAPDSKLYSVEKSPIEKISIASPRNFLESSPLRKHSRASASDLTSPYFGNSSMKSRADTFEGTLPSPKLLSSSDHYLEENRQTILPSQTDTHLLTNPHYKKEYQAKISYNTHETANLSTSRLDHEKSLSEIEQDDDVNLIGNSNNKSSLSRVREDLEKELNDTIVDFNDEKKEFVNHSKLELSKGPEVNPRDTAVPERIVFEPTQTLSRNEVETIHSDDGS